MLLKKVFNVGFEDIAVVDRTPFGLDDLRRYPLFAPEFIDFLSRVMPERRHREMVFSIVVVGRKPEDAKPLGPPNAGKARRSTDGISKLRTGL